MNPTEGQVDLLKHHSSSIFEDQTPIELVYNIQITATMKKQQNKIILHYQNGVIPARSFTAILGPSGSGKTTFLNFLAGRLMSNNLILEGQYKINGESIKTVEPYSNQIGYVMQEDALLGTLTPKQCLTFAANLKLNLSPQQKRERVEELIEELGLKLCQDTKIGNTFIKGVSGGERKRTSIGLELITNPNIIFLDEPTTGLDSTTALQVIQLLRGLSNKGKTIISTIHQPSSQLFCEFDRLMLLVDGKCIYAGEAERSYEYFGQMGYQCPQLMNASEFYLDLMSFQAEQQYEEASYEQKRAEHDLKINKMEQYYKNSPLCLNIKQNENLSPVQPESNTSVSIFMEFWLIFRRSLLCQFRNPMDFTLKIVQSVFTAIIVIIVYGKIDNSIEQNVRGIAFFLVSQNAFGGIQGTLATFSMERPVFIRERYSKTYSCVNYFIARTFCNFPFEIIYPTVGAAIVYWATGLGNQTFEEFTKIICVVNITYFQSASYGLLYSTVIPKLETAMALVPVIIIPFMLLGGFFINLNEVHDIRVIFYPIMYLSPFKYGFQAAMLALGNKHEESVFPKSFSANIWCAFGIGMGVRLLALIAMQIVSSPKRPRLHNVKSF